jgi:hypothetical protein
MRDFPSVRATCFAGFARFALGARLAAQRNSWRAMGEYVDGKERFHGRW